MLKIYSPGYIYKPNVYAEIWGILLKTGGSMQNESVFPTDLGACICAPN